jgi:hypothetical protein
MALVADTLEAEGISFSPDPETGFVRFRVDGEHGPFDMAVLALPEIQLIKCYALLPLQVPAPRLADMAEFVARANFGLLFGNFELDFSDGEMRFKTSLHTDGGAANPEVVRRLVLLNAQTANDYLRGIRLLLEQGHSPQEAIIEVEQRPEAEGTAPPSDE